jgi:sigma-54 dependent transcriptional regulator, acetoin dehydrogenase operon transcriptional activator AcoR
LRGALDITSFDSVPGFDVFSLVVDAAAAIENRLFMPDRERLLVRFHVRPELVDTPLACLLQVDAEGRVSGANRAAEQLLCAARSTLLGRPFESLFDRATRHLFGAGPSTRHGRLVEMRSHAGLHVWASFGGADQDAAAPSLHEQELNAMEALPAEPPAPPSLRELECRTIEQTLAELGGNVAATARRLGISRNTIYRRMAGRGGTGPSSAD